MWDASISGRLEKELRPLKKYSMPVIKILKRYDTRIGQNISQITVKPKNDTIKINQDLNIQIYEKTLSNWIKMQKFIKTIDNIISKERLSSYSSADEHCKNLRTIAILTPNIAMIEISIRNIVDFYLKQIYGIEWIKNSSQEQILAEKDSIDKRFKFTDLSHNQYLSNFSFGKIIYLAKENHLQTYIFENLNELDFREFSDSNRNFFFFNNRKNDFSDIDKADILLSLLLTIRNRCYHWENILKIRSVDNQTYPRITHRLNDTNIGIMPKELKKFLSIVLDKFIGII